MTATNDQTTVSGRHEACKSCGDPQFVCPGTLRRFLRCCTRCTHVTQNDLDWQHTQPTTRQTKTTPALSDPVLLEAS